MKNRQLMSARDKFTRICSAFSYLFFCFLASASLAQTEIEVQNPPGQNWQIIENSKSAVIFPKGVENKASRIAAIVNYIEKDKKYGIGSRSLSIPIIMHNLSMEPNGFVAYAPFRSELYPLAIPDWNETGPTDWIDLLAVHEYRHVLQASNTDVGFTKLSRLLTGRLGWATTRQITTPNWFSEGDAVLSETLLTSSGRGRLPSFSMEQRAIMNTGKRFSYLKARHGSYKTPMPNHYPFGYTLSLYVREHYGENAWGDVLRKANYFSPPLYPFAGALKKVTGYRPAKIYKMAYAEMDSAVSGMLQNRQFSDLDTLSKKQRVVTYYTYNHKTNEGYQLARKSSFNETAAIIKLTPDGREQKLVNIGHSDNPYTSFGNELVVWLENQPHPYYGNVDFSRIAVYNHITDKKNYVLNRSKTYFVAVSTDDKQLAAIQVDSSMNFSISMYNTKGDFIKTLKSQEGAEIGYPIFDSENNGILYYTIKEKSRQFWVKHDLHSDSFEFISEGYAYAMVEPSQNSEYLFFRAGFNGIDNIFAVSKTGQKNIFQVTEAKVGSGYPEVSDEEIFFSNFDMRGSSLVKSALVLKPYQVVPPTENEAFATVNSLSEADNILEHIPDTDTRSRLYKSWIESWRLHSWGILPGLGSFSSDNKIPGLSQATGFVILEDILSRNSVNLEYTYFINEGENSIKIDWSTAPAFPVFNVGLEQRNRFRYLESGSLVGEYKEHEARAGIRVPLLTFKNNFSFQSRLQADVKGIKPYIVQENGEIDNSLFGLYSTSAYFSVSRRQAYQNLQPKLGATFLGEYNQSFRPGVASKTSLAGIVYLPGIAKNHGISALLSYQYEDLENSYQFPDNFTAGRGYAIGGLEFAKRLGLNYTLPILYPDFGIPGFSYFRRLRATGFLDLAQIKGNQVTTTVKSVGLELTMDQTLFNLINLPVGIRSGYRFPNPYLDYESPFFFNLILGN